MKRKLFALLAALALLVTLAACAQDAPEPENTTPPASDTPNEPEARETPDESETPDEPETPDTPETPEAATPAEVDAALQEVFSQFLRLEYWTMTPEEFDAWLLEQGWTAQRYEDGHLVGYSTTVGGLPLGLDLTLCEDGSAYERLTLWRGLYTSGYARFADRAVPTAACSLTGILEYGSVTGYGKRFILQMRDEGDCSY